MSDAQIAAEAGRLQAALRQLTAHLNEHESVWVCDRRGDVLASDMTDHPSIVSATERESILQLAAYDSGTAISDVHASDQPAGNAGGHAGTPPPFFCGFYRHHQRFALAR